MLHSILADKTVKNHIRHRIGPLFRYYRTFFNLVSIVLAAILVLWQINMPTKMIWHPIFLQYIFGGMMAVAGITGMGICLKKYFDTSDGFNDLIYEGGTPVLVTDGLNRFVRHPLYFSTFILIWGIFLCFPVWTLLVVNTVITVYTLIGIRLEEKKLISIFGEGYIRYREKVPMICPGIRGNCLL
jgi:protein-S-isoprenylcysteine O-methyltransferase Ste14